MLTQLEKIYRSVLQELDHHAPLRHRLDSRSGPPYSQLLALGKAAASMASVALPYCAPPPEGFVLTKESHLKSTWRAALVGVECWEAGHPLPDQRSLLASHRLLEWIEQVRRPEHLLLLISGGASSLLELPSPPLRLPDLIELNRCLLASGMPIEEINVVRKHLSLLKGGQLGEKLVARFQRVTQLIVSDVGEGPLSLVGSGPALADPSSLEEADRLLDRLEGIALPALLRTCRAALRETPKTLPLSAQRLADHRQLTELARHALGPLARRDPQWAETVHQEIETLAADWGRLAVRLREQGFQGVLVASGEPLVRLQTARPGRGGRCQELAVRFAREVAGQPGIALLAGSSDGTDGPTPYAGARVDGHSWPRLCQRHGKSQAEDLLGRHDASGLLESCRELLLETGPTGHNLNDLFLLSIQPNIEKFSSW
jgi:glycerate 2-kinase